MPKLFFLKQKIATPKVIAKINTDQFIIKLPGAASQLPFLLPPFKVKFVCFLANCSEYSSFKATGSLLQL